MIAGAGFAMTAWREAWRRSFSVPVDMTGMRPPDQRNAAYLEPDVEYYRILDRAQHCWDLVQTVAHPGDRWTSTL